MSRLPSTSITQGHDVHVVFPPAQRPAALALFEAFCAYVVAQKIPHDRAMVFEEPVGPWPTPMWQVLLNNPDPDGLSHDLGRCVAWLMINRGGLSVMIHPNTEQTADFGGGLADHQQHMLWMGPPLPLRLDIFTPA